MNILEMDARNKPIVLTKKGNIVNIRVERLPLVLLPMITDNSRKVTVDGDSKSW